MHYTPVGTEQSDRSSLGLVFADPKTIRQEVRNEIVGNIGLRIPPGDADYRLTAKKKFRQDTLLLNLAPHMHVRGKAFRFELELADGTREILLDVPRYDFNWQLRYDLVEPRLIPAGSRLHCYARWDNSATTRPTRRHEAGHLRRADVGRNDVRRLQTIVPHDPGT